MINLQDSIFWFSVIRFIFNKLHVLKILYKVGAFESNSFDHNSFTYNSMRIIEGISNNEGNKPKTYLWKSNMNE